MADILALIVVGLVAGSAAVSVFQAKRKNFLKNLLLGVLGALIGGFIFNALNLDLPDILKGEITIADIVVAFIGAILVIFVMRILDK